MVPTVEWKEGAVRLLDQSRLPSQVEFLDCRDYRSVAQAIRELKVRGAPAIGVTAAMGVALGAQSVDADEYSSFVKQVDAICDHLAGEFVSVYVPTTPNPTSGFFLMLPR